MQIFVGCPIWSFKGWVGNFYPAGTKPAEFLREYARRLTTVEGNTTFYAVPPEKTIKSWAADLPPGFRFCPKLPKAISHQGTLVSQVERARQFATIMSQLGACLGPMFLQLPPRYSSHQLDDLKSFLESWPQEFRLAVEVRHPDWFDEPSNETLNRLLAEHNMARVTIDTRPIRSLAGDEILTGSVYQTLLEARERKPDLPVTPQRTADFAFVRYIGHPDLEINYPFLDQWAGYFSAELKTGVDVFAFCHSPDNLAAPYLCRSLHQRVAQNVKIPPLPWDEIRSDTFEQGKLL